MMSSFRLFGYTPNDTLSRWTQMLLHFHFQFLDQLRKGKLVSFFMFCKKFRQPGLHSLINRHRGLKCHSPVGSLDRFHAQLRVALDHFSRSIAPTPTVFLPRMSSEFPNRAQNLLHDRNPLLLLQLSARGIFSSSFLRNSSGIMFNPRELMRLICVSRSDSGLLPFIFFHNPSRSRSLIVLAQDSLFFLLLSAVPFLLRVTSPIAAAVPSPFQTHSLLFPYCSASVIAFTDLLNRKMKMVMLRLDRGIQLLYFSASPILPAILSTIRATAFFPFSTEALLGLPHTPPGQYFTLSLTVNGFRDLRIFFAISL